MRPVVPATPSGVAAAFRPRRRRPSARRPATPPVRTAGHGLGHSTRSPAVARAAPRCRRRCRPGRIPL